MLQSNNLNLISHTPDECLNQQTMGWGVPMCVVVNRNSILDLRKLYWQNWYVPVKSFGFEKIGIFQQTILSENSQQALLYRLWLLELMRSLCARSDIVLFLILNALIYLGKIRYGVSWSFLLIRHLFIWCDTIFSCPYSNFSSFCRYRVHILWLERKTIIKGIVSTQILPIFIFLRN